MQSLKASKEQLSNDSENRNTDNISESSSTENKPGTAVKHLYNCQIAHAQCLACVLYRRGVNTQHYRDSVMVALLEGPTSSRLHCDTAIVAHNRTLPNPKGVLKPLVHSSPKMMEEAE